MPIEIYNQTNGASLGTISEDDLQALKDLLEEESTSDSNYFINRQTIDNLKEAGASAGLLDTLNKEMGPSDVIQAIQSTEETQMTEELQQQFFDEYVVKGFELEWKKT